MGRERAIGGDNGEKSGRYHAMGFPGTHTHHKVTDVEAVGLAVLDPSHHRRAYRIADRDGG